MTTIAYRNGVIAADSQTTVDTEAGGARYFKCIKLFRKIVKHASTHEEEVVLATAGESFSSLVFVDWYGSGKDAPEILVHGEADFTVLALTKDGLFEYDKWCRGEKIAEPFYAIGSGAKAALGAMHAGVSAKRAVEIACMVDPYTRAPVTVWSLKKPKKQTRKPTTLREITAAGDSGHGPVEGAGGAVRPG